MPVKIALLADIHGNLAALEPVLEAVDASKPDVVAILGDIIGYYYQSAEVIDRLRDQSNIVVRGNHERAYLDMLDGRDDGAGYRSKYGSSLDIAAKTLTAAQNDWLRDLQDNLVVQIGGRELHFTHEAPNVEGGYLYPDSSAAKFEATAPRSAAALFFGHSHYSFTAVTDGRLLVNPGSVGQARDMGGMAQWAIVHLETLAVELKRTPYETKSVESATLRNDPDLPYLREVLRRGRDRG